MWWGHVNKPGGDQRSTQESEVFLGMCRRLGEPKPKIAMMSRGCIGLRSRADASKPGAPWLSAWSTGLLHEQLESTVTALAERIAELTQFGLLTKQAVNQAEDVWRLLGRHGLGFRPSSLRPRQQRRNWERCARRLDARALRHPRRRSRFGPPSTLDIEFIMRNYLS